MNDKKIIFVLTVFLIGALSCWAIEFWHSCWLKRHYENYVKLLLSLKNTITKLDKPSE